jgi:HSP20 family protein
MREHLTYMKEYTVYPGEYNPSQGVKSLIEELQMPGKNFAVRPLVNMDEFKDCFTIEVVLPGVRREDIYINIHDAVLSIAVLNTNRKEFRSKKLQIHEFDTTSLERHILLPDNADTEFVSAEYKQGILSLYIPKTEEPSKTGNKQIIVY